MGGWLSDGCRDARKDEMKVDGWTQGLKERRKEAKTEKRRKDGHHQGWNTDGWMDR